MAWTLDPAWAGLAGCFGSLDQVFALQGPQLTSSPLSELIRVEHAGVGYYVKRYHKAGKGLRRWLGRPRLQAEWQNLQHFRQWGIGTAALVGWGMEYRHGRFRRGALITREIAGAIDLGQLARAQDPRLADPRWVDGISRELARVTRLMHDRHFAHNDLKWRNLLVDGEDRLYLIDCPMGDFWSWPLLARRQLKDLACLDKVAKYCLSRSQRLRFYLHYCQRARTRTSDRRVIRQILGYFEGRE